MTDGFDGGWGARRQAALAEHEKEEFGHEDLPDLAALLDHEDAAVRAGAVWRIAELADDDPRSVERFVDDVAACVTDPDAWVRRGATWALEEVAGNRSRVSRSAMDALTVALDDDDPLVRENAIVGIASIASEEPRIAAEVRDELAAVVQNADDPRLQRYAREALERIAERLPEESLGGPVDVRSPTRRVEHTPSANVVGGGDEEGTETQGQVESNAGQSDAERRSRRRRRAPIGGSSPPDSVPEPSTSSVSLTRIETEERVRSGPLLEVYRARAETGTAAGTVPVELRALTEVPEDANAAGVADAFRDAFDDWARIDEHETVLTTLGRADGPPRVATEVADGRAFRAYAARSAFEEALYYASCLVRAVAHAHGNDVIHGGLSPRAIGFVEPIEDAWHVAKVADWGIGPVVVAHLDRPPVPAPYAAPEQIAPGVFGTPDQATDVYGLGALLYALFAGRPPYGEDAAEIANRIRAAERGETLPSDLPDPVPPSEHDEEMPESVDRLLDRALSRDRMGRYETVADLRRDLEALIEEHATWR